MVASIVHLWNRHQFHLKNQHVAQISYRRGQGVKVGITYLTRFVSIVQDLDVGQEGGESMPMSELLARAEVEVAAAAAATGRVCVVSCR